MPGSASAHVGQERAGTWRVPARAVCLGSPLMPPARALWDGEARQHSERCLSFMPCLFVFFFFFSLGLIQVP